MAHEREVQLPNLGSVRALAMREIILETETTGFEPHRGDRLVEIACLELIDVIPTGRIFHVYIDPSREMPPELERVHGLSTEFLRGQAGFEHPAVVDAFLDFVGDAPIVAHNAGFDRAFVNWELDVINRAPIQEARWVDTLALAKERFPGMHNSLDALCNRFEIAPLEDDEPRAMIDARLLATIYFELKRGAHPA